ncbi:hypothetical protein D5085_18060 [Ectothiorhodospiraceae bacterium BW-2]|nr:hypothetical protein D5085_18060 [Ectothiorhodospiraceae bacterium BW-2]
MAKEELTVPLTELQQQLLKAVRTLLRPLVKLLLQQGVTLPMLIDQLRPLYIEEAKAAQVGKANMSALSLATGIHRKEIKRQLEQPLLSEPPAGHISLGTRLLALWLGEPSYSDAEGNPLPLPRKSEQGVDFESLVESVSRDVRPRSVLDDWLRLGLVEIDAEQRVVLRQQAFVPQQGEEELLHFFGRNLRDHLSAGVHNLRHREEPFIDRALFYDGLSEASLQQLREVSRQQGLALLQQLNRQALALAKVDDQQSGERGRMTFGLYYYQESGEGESRQREES